MATFLSSIAIPRLAKMASLVVLSAVLLTSCERKPNPDASLQHGAKCSTGPNSADAISSGTATSSAIPLHQTLSSVVTVAGIRQIEGSADVEVMFNENTQFFHTSGEALVNMVKAALANSKPLKITFDPWAEELITATYAGAEAEAASARGIVDGRSGVHRINLDKSIDEDLDNPAEMGIMNTTDPGLNNLIPDFATAQMMFDYICRQCCYLPGPYAIDYCIPFQYCRDGCYARAHKMCWIINNRYKYGTKKIFSFANAGSDKLCVQGQKWGGCCIRWWYHVAPLVTVKTPTGPKAYVFDPAMFNQPVLLSTWLHAQENPACASTYTAHVTMINVQPTSSYAPSGSSGMTFSTDPMYTATNNTLISYSALVTCP